MEGSEAPVTVLSSGASVVAHSVHYGVLAIGLFGLLALVGPRWAAPRDPHRNAPRDRHEQRVLALRRQFDPAGRSAVVRPDLRPALVLVRTTSAERLLLPLAVVSSAAAAGVHAAVGPAHFREATLFGLFFTVAALFQILWSVAVVHRPSRTAYVLGAVGNLAVVALWAVTRSAGLPWGLLPRPEAVGAWDVCCAVWEIAVAVTCVALRRSTSRPQRLTVPSWADWSTVARGWATASVLILLALSFSGAGA